MSHKDRKDPFMKERSGGSFDTPLLLLLLPEAESPFRAFRLWSSRSSPETGGEKAIHFPVVLCNVLLLFDQKLDMRL